MSKISQTKGKKKCLSINFDDMSFDDAEKPPVSYTVLTYSKQCLHNTKREDLAESTSVVPVKYPLKIKLEFQCQSG